MGGEFFSVTKFGWFPCQRTEIGSLRLTMKCVFQPAMFEPSLGFPKTLGVTATCGDFFPQSDSQSCHFAVRFWGYTFPCGLNCFRIC